MSRCTAGDKTKASPVFGDFQSADDFGFFCETEVCEFLQFKFRLMYKKCSFKYFVILRTLYLIYDHDIFYFYKGSKSISKIIYIYRPQKYFYIII